MGAGLASRSIGSASLLGTQPILPLYAQAEGCFQGIFRCQKMIHFELRLHSRLGTVQQA
jgi:hypothetical protein